MSTLAGGRTRLKALKPAEPTRDIPTAVKDPALVAKRRRQIVDATVQLFIKKGFHKTTTREMAQAAGFSIGTLYEYVASKEDVLYLVCQAIHDEMEDRLRQRIRHAGSGAQALAAAIEAYFSVCDQMSDHILLIYQETKSLPPESMRFVLAHEERITQVFAELLDRGVGDYSLRPLNRAEIELMAHNIAVLGHMWTFRRWSLRPRFSLEQYIALQSELILGQLR
ncbi:MAG: TetR/AcrR family transcriptional regulator [Desulfarculus sp.]|nr:TetR/AcrR family transcriptional regulator [Desulfarculus sp.]